MFIKGFDENLCCRGMQFEIGKTYETGYPKKELKCCSSTVIHFCDNLKSVHEFYDVRKNNRYCEVEPLGDVIKKDNKYGTNKIKIVREITGEELAHLKEIERGNTGIFNTGDWNTGDCNTGDCNTGDWNTGNRNTGNRNTGDWNTGDWNTGDWNTGNRNTGNCNTGDWNTGNRNTGNCNTGNCNTGNRNTGDWNTGDWNTGNRNTGIFNACNRSTGLFNTKERTLTMFNKDSEMTWNEFINSEYYDAIYSSPFSLTEWIYYTEEEKKNSPIRQAIGGYLKKYTFKEACKNWWDNMTDENKDIIQSIPNFDKKIFKEITGIEVQE